MPLQGVKSEQKIIIYGGAFDPPHKGHFALIKSAFSRLDPAAFYIVPAFSSPLKAAPRASFELRKRMLSDGLRAVGLPVRSRLMIHPFEYNRGRVTYTWETVAFFKKLHPGADLYFLMGSDCLENFHKWKNYRRILSGATLLVGARPGYDQRDPAAAEYVRLAGKFPSVSSSGLRAELFAGGRPAALLPSTIRCIERAGCYMGGLRRRLRKIMTRARFAHSCAVAALAAELALKYGIDPDKAALAGLLHDAARDLSSRALKEYMLRRRLLTPAARGVLETAPALLHAGVGADMAAKRFGVKDRSVLNAIKQHTLGALEPDLLSKIIYIADLAAYDRNFPQARAVAALAFRDLDAAYMKANYVKLVYAFKTGKPDIQSVKVWNNLLAQEKNR